MKLGTIAGTLIGMAAGVTVVSICYPDVYRRMMRDGKKMLKKTQKLMSKNM